MGSRTWVKIYCDKWLEGTLRQETPEFRGVWTDVLALAGSGKFADTGIIALANGVGYTDLQIAAILRINPDIWVTCKQRLIETERISLNGANIIHILNWQKYQSEYQRQKPFRGDKSELQDKVTPSSDQRRGEKELFTPIPSQGDRPELLEKVTTPSWVQKEREKEREKEIEIRDNDTLVNTPTLDVILKAVDKQRLQIWRSWFDKLVTVYPKKDKAKWAWEGFCILMSTGDFTPELLETVILPGIKKREQLEDWRVKKGRLVPKLEDFLDNNRWKMELEKVKEDDQWLVR
jgi:hypothetical protein